MFHTNYNEFNLIINSVTDGTQPATTLGPNIVPGNNVYGSYVTIITGSLVTDDVYGIMLIPHGNNVSTAARDTIMTVGIDSAGSNNYVDFIPDLLVSSAGALSAANGHVGGIRYYFPLFIKAGTSIGVKGSVNNATVSSFNCFVSLFCKPSRPELVKAGSFVRTFGANAAASRGTLVTLGTGSEGAWTELGTISDRLLWYWEVGFGLNTGNMVANVHFVDVGLGDPNANIKLAMQNVMFVEAATENINKPVTVNNYRTGVRGDKVYGRAQSLASEISASIIIYGVGG